MCSKCFLARALFLLSTLSPEVTHNSYSPRNNELSGRGKNSSGFSPTFTDFSNFSFSFFREKTFFFGKEQKTNLKWCKVEAGLRNAPHVASYYSFHYLASSEREGKSGEKVFLLPGRGKNVDSILALGEKSRSARTQTRLVSWEGFSRESESRREPSRLNPSGFSHHRIEGKTFPVPDSKSRPPRPPLAVLFTLLARRFLPIISHFAFLWQMSSHYDLFRFPFINSFSQQRRANRAPIEYVMERQTSWVTPRTTFASLSGN
jgi:hypothetical protein